MKTYFLSFPRFSISLTVPDELALDARSGFLHSIRPLEEVSPQEEYAIRSNDDGFGLFRNGRLSGRFGTPVETLCHLEEEIENRVVRAIDDWVAFHAGAVKIHDAACLIAGDPDRGKTTMTLNLIEMGQIFLCEEIAPVDPVNLLVYPYPQVLSLSGEVAEAYLSICPVQNGSLRVLGPHVARYRPFQAASEPAPLKTILIPEYDPSRPSKIEELAPADVLTELLGYCFPPNRDEEHLFDSVIRICEAARIFRVRTSSLSSMRQHLKELFAH